MTSPDAAQVAARSPFGLVLGTILSLVGMTNGCADPTPSPARTSEPAAVAQASASPAPTSCGKTGLPDCPLQEWMKANVQAYLKAGDTERLAAALGTLAEHEPPGYSGWADSAKKASEAARSGDLARARAECKHCHDEHRSRFRAELRTTRLF
jgi:hypothetical protein